MGQQHIPAEGGACTQPEMRHSLGTAAENDLLPLGYKRKGLFDFLEKNFSLRREGDAAGISFKERDAEITFQLLDGAADGGLADIQLFGRPGNVACFSNNIKNMI